MKTHEEFVSLLTASKVATDKVATHFASTGHCAKIIPTLIAPDHESRYDYVDQGDIEITKRCEVKHRPDMDFTSIDDFKWDTVIVDEEYKIKRLPAQTLAMYAIVNAAMTHMILIPASTKEHWLVQEKFDKRHGANRRFMVCPKELLTCVEIKA